MRWGADRALLGDQPISCAPEPANPSVTPPTQSAGLSSQALLLHLAHLVARQRVGEDDRAGALVRRELVADVRRELVLELVASGHSCRRHDEGDDALAEVLVRHADHGRSAARRVGKECVSTCKSRWSPYP